MVFPTFYLVYVCISTVFGGEFLGPMHVSMHMECHLFGMQVPF